MPSRQRKFPIAPASSMRVLNYAATIADSSGLAGPPLPSQIDRYEIVSLLGSGSFAAVYLAYDPALDASVAIKVLAQHHAFDHELRERFVNEARLLRRISSDRLVTVHDIGEHEGQPYIVMEALTSGTFADRVRGNPSVTDDVVRRVIAELGSCLQALEVGGVIHRDIKPSNLLVRRPSGVEGPNGTVLADDEHLVLADFGLARGRERSALTIGGGTEGYLAPEQRLPSATLDHRCDFYGATAVVADVAGRRSTGGGVESIDGVDPFADALRVGLATDPADRPDGAADWTRRLLDGFDLRLGSAAGTRSGRDGPRRATRWRLWGALVAAVGIAAVLVIGGIWWSSDGDGPADLVEVSDDGPQIIGPVTLLVGEPGTYLHPTNRAGVTYQWTLPTGAASVASEIVLTPTEPDDLILLLTATEDGVETTSRLVIDVRNQ